MMAIKKNDIITVEYEGRLESGEIFDSSYHGDHSHPLEFKVGVGEVIPGFDSAVIGMEKYEEKEFVISPEQAYGEHNPKLQQEIPRERLKLDKEPELGMILNLSTPDGRRVSAKIINILKDKITIDLNPPLAGKTLIFKIKVIDVHANIEKEDTK